MMKMCNLTEILKIQEPRCNQASHLSKKVGQALCFSLVVCLLLFVGAAPRPVLAQAATAVSFSPVPVVIDTRVGGTTVVDVLVRNEVNIGVFSIQINYDPDMALISQWVLGSFVPEAQS